MKSTLFPPPPGCSQPVCWTGTKFVAQGLDCPVLVYDSGQSNWTDELTDFHEATAGDNHYIDVASRRAAIRALASRLPPSGHPTIMDIGCSSGFMLKELALAFPHASIAGADYVRGPLERLARTLTGIPLLQFNLVRCPLPDDSLDAVVLLNVLEHIEEDKEAMLQVCRILKPGGVLALEVPAGPGLYCVYDKQLMHFRRYRMKDLVEALAKSGLDVVEKSHLGFFLYPAFWFTKKRDQRHLNAGEEARKAIVAANMAMAGNSPILHGLMRMEAALREKVYLPIGIRCLVTCIKPIDRN